MANLKGKRVLITGAAQGIGRCMANHFAKEGSILILTDINAAALEKAAGELGKSTTVYKYVADVSRREDVEKMAGDVVGKIGGLDILINNAGIGYNGEIVETSLEVWKKIMDVNFWGPLYMTYAFLPYMIRAKSGHIVNVASGQAFFMIPTWGPYAALKLAFGAYSELLRLEVKKFGLKVTTVYPFMVNTGFYSGIEGETFGAKLSMKLVPLYSMSPERVGKIIYKAVKKEKAVEMVSIFNQIGKYTKITPISDVFSFVALKFLGKSPEVLRKEQNF